MSPTLFVWRACAVVCGSLVAVPALAAGDRIPLEPALRINVAFGSARPAHTTFGVRLDYADSVRDALPLHDAIRDGARGAAPAAAGDARVLPALLEWHLDGAGTHALLTNGLTLGAGPLWRRAAVTEDDAVRTREWSWGENVGAMVLAGGVALAAIIAVAGDTADDITEDHVSSNGGDGNGGNGIDDSGSGDCAVPAPDAPGASDTCVIGG